MHHQHRINNSLSSPITVEFARPGTAGGRLESDSPPRNSDRPLLRTISTLRLTAANSPYNTYSVPASVAASARTSYTRVDMADQDAQEMEREEEYRRLQEIQPEQQQQQQGEAQQQGQEGQREESEPVPQTPQVFIAFLLVSGRKRVMSFEPETTVGRVKELVWSGWPSDWQDERPPAPSYLRILYLGRILQDEDTLTKLNFPSHTPDQPPAPAPTPTIVHLSIRPGAAGSIDDDPKKKRRRMSISPGTEGGCCGCCIM